MDLLNSNDDDLSEEENAPEKPKREYPNITCLWNKIHNQNISRNSRQFKSFAKLKRDYPDSYMKLPEYIEVLTKWDLLMDQWQTALDNWKFDFPKKVRNDEIRKTREKHSLQFESKFHLNSLNETKRVKIPLESIKDTLATSEFGRCVICLSNVANCVALPCAHFHFCVGCSRSLVLNAKINNCPSCRQEITEFKKVHLV